MKTFEFWTMDGFLLETAEAADPYDVIFELSAHTSTDADEIVFIEIDPVTGEEIEND